MSLSTRISYEGWFRLWVGVALALLLVAWFIPYGWVLGGIVGVAGVVVSCRILWFWKRVSARLPIFLMLHSVNDTIVHEDCANNSIRPKELEQLIVNLKAAGYRFQTAYEASVSPCRRSVVLTFDDGFVDNYTELFPILKRHQVKATLFVTNLGATNPEFLSEAQIREMAASGLVEFGGHTAEHTTLGQASEEATRVAITENFLWLSNILGDPPKTFAYPCGQHTEHSLKVLQELEIPFAFTMYKKMRPVEEAPLLIHRQIIPRGKTPLQNYLLATRGKYKI